MPTPPPLLASLLPSAWFDGNHQIMLILLAVVAMAAVIKGADWLVEGAAGLASKLGMPKVIIGATIVSLGTTAPEAAVSVLAAFGGNPGLALGNGVGSIIADTGLIFGLGCVMVALPADRFVLSRQGWVQFGSAVLLAGLGWALYAVFGREAAITRPIGALLLLGLVAYLAISVKWSRQHPHGEPHLITPPPEAPEAEAGASGGSGVDLDMHDHAEDHSVLWLLGMGVIGLAVVIFGGDLLVGSVSELAQQYQVPDDVIAGTIVAFGTSLPELVVGMQSLRKGHAELLVGNVIGADILNVLFVIGAAGVAAPLTIAGETTSFIYITLPTMVLMMLYFRLCIFKATRDGHFSKWMGYPLLLGYAAFFVLSYLTTN